MKGIRIFGGKLKIGWLMFPAVIVLIALGMGEAVLVYIPVMIVHEWAHLLAASALGVRITEMELWPFGCSAKIESFALSRSKEIIVAAAGPAVNLVMASAVFVIHTYMHPIAIADRLITANIAIAAINMLPALPLDGGRIARAAFSSFLGYRRATRVTAVTGVLFSVIMLGVGIYAAVNGVVNPSFFVMAVFLCIAAAQALHGAAYTLVRDFSGKRDTLSRRRTLAVNRFAAMKTDTVGDVMRMLETGKYNIVTVLNDDMGIAAELDEREILDGMMTKGPGVMLSSLRAGSRSSRRI